MLRSAASPGSVGFGRFGSGTSGLLMTPLPAGHLPSVAEKDTGRPLGALVMRVASFAARSSALLDLRLAELDVLLGDRIVFLLAELLGHGARVLAGHVVEAGVSARHELDLDGGGLRHGVNLVASVGREPSGWSRNVKEAGPEAVGWAKEVAAHFRCGKNVSCDMHT